MKQALLNYLAVDKKSKFEIGSPATKSVLGTPQKALGLGIN